ncbi:MAG: SDR family oxidoreductase, partial [Candidatus Lokiarchaeota archaeon]|nr:SDR family oxidoreductase [Candidatus Lokiarchaeota archaeon]
MDINFITNIHRIIQLRKMNLEKRLEGKKIFISGAGSGLGKAIALRFAREGADIAINDINEENANNTKTEVEKLGQKSIVFIGDVSDSSSVKNMVKTYYKEWDTLDVLVNNAGVGATASKIMSMKEEAFDHIININIKSVFLMSKWFSKKMRKRKTADDQLRGKIINMSSMRGLRGRDNFGAYSVSKAGVLSLTQTLSIELGKYRITVNAICPGLIHTPIYGPISYEDLASMSEPICLTHKPVGHPEDVAGVAFFLASSDSDWITGQYVP